MIVIKPLLAALAVIAFEVLFPLHTFTRKTSRFLGAVITLSLLTLLMIIVNSLIRIGTMPWELLLMYRRMTIILIVAGIIVIGVMLLLNSCLTHKKKSHERYVRGTYLENLKNFPEVEEEVRIRVMRD